SCSAPSVCARWAEPSGAWKAGEAASFAALSCSSAAGPAFRVTSRGRLRDSFILSGLQPSSSSYGDPRAPRHLRRVLANEDLQLQCPAYAELLLQVLRLQDGLVAPPEG